MLFWFLHSSCFIRHGVWWYETSRSDGLNCSNLSGNSIRFDMICSPGLIVPSYRCGYLPVPDFHDDAVTAVLLFLPGHIQIFMACRFDLDWPHLMDFSPSNHQFMLRNHIQAIFLHEQFGKAFFIAIFVKKFRVRNWIIFDHIPRRASVLVRSQERHRLPGRDSCNCYDSILHDSSRDILVLTILSLTHRDSSLILGFHICSWMMRFNLRNPFLDVWNTWSTI
jgi:hypothetical protein